MYLFGQKSQYYAYQGNNIHKIGRESQISFSRSSSHAEGPDFGHGGNSTYADDPLNQSVTDECTPAPQHKFAAGSRDAEPADSGIESSQGSTRGTSTGTRFKSRVTSEFDSKGSDGAVGTDQSHRRRGSDWIGRRGIIFGISEGAEKEEHLVVCDFEDDEIYNVQITSAAAAAVLNADPTHSPMQNGASSRTSQSHGRSSIIEMGAIRSDLTTNQPSV